MSTKFNVKEMKLTHLAQNDLTIILNQTKNVTIFFISIVSGSCVYKA